MNKNLLNQYAVAGITDTGCGRKHNEDNILIDEELGLLIIADGMGGHQAGEIASMEAITFIQRMIQLDQRIKKSSWFSRFLKKILQQSLDCKAKILNLEKALLGANHHIYQLNLERNQISGTGMGTTVAGCWLLEPGIMLIFHIGDSRIYRFRNQQLEALSKDHSVLQEWYDMGCIGEKPGSNVISRALGPYQETKADIQTVQIEKNDSFLLCSDGLSDMLDDDEIEEKLQGITANQLETYSQKLLVSALERGGKDNVSIILMAN